MKKVLYSIPVKAAAFIMCIAVVAMAAGDVLHMFSYVKEGYSFDSNFDESYAVVNMLSVGRDRLLKLISGSENVQSEIGISNDLEYYAKNFNSGKIISNTEEKDRDYFEMTENEAGVYYGDIYYIIERDGGDVYEDGNLRVMRGKGAIYGTDDYVAYIRIKDETASELKSDWDYSRSVVMNTVDEMPVYAVLLLIGIVYLSFAAGRIGRDDEIHMMTIDRIPIDITLVCTAVFAVIALYGICCLFYLRQSAGIDAGQYGMLIGGVAAAVIGTAYMSMIRNLKNHSFVSRCLTVTIIKWIWKKCIWIIKGVLNVIRVKAKRLIKSGYVGIRRLIAAKMTIKLILAALVAYTAAIAIASLFVGSYVDDVWGWFFVIWLLTAAAVYVVYRAISGMDAVREGLKHIRSGEILYTIPKCKSAYANSIAEDINAIGEGMQKAVEISVKSEKMKAELITNVSHDLKTPLTAIINYTDLLMKEDLIPEEANDYVRIIDQKSKKLKQLTADLFDISKVRSGNEEIETERIDYKLLISQAAAELDRDIRDAELEFVIKMPKSEVELVTDGKKLSRVYENLIINAVKYSLKGTRVYISLYKTESGYTTEIKNIAGYKMDFEDDEITERFVRGDKSRHGDGSGLGLAIAKSYVELLGGKFTVKTDGDLFKVIIELNSIE